MYIDYKKLLPAVLRPTRWGQLIEAYQSVIQNDLIPDKVSAIETQYKFEDMTQAEKINLCSIFGYNLLRYTGYTGSTEYLNKNLKNLVQRILWKNTQRGYQYLFYNYNAKGEAYSTTYDSDGEFWQPQNSSSLIEITSPAYLDRELYLDSTDDDFLYLDSEVTSTIALTRLIVLAIEFLQTEDTTQFLSANSLLVFENDTDQLKRTTERIIYEPFLVVYMNPDSTIYRHEYTTYDNSESTYLESILLSGSSISYSDIYQLQVGSGSHEIVSGAIISGVAELVETFVSGQLQEISTTTSLTSELRKKLYSSDRDQADFKELALIDGNGDCFFYSKFPYVRYPSKYQHGFRLQFSVYQTYVISFNSVGGSSVASQRVKINELITEPTNPTKSGYAFVDWYTDAEYTTKWLFADGINSDMTLYAKWIEAFIFTFDSQGGSSIDNQLVVSGETATEPTDPTYGSKVFYDWYESTGYTNIWDFETPITEDTTVYAKWVYTVNFNVQGGLPELNVAPDYYGQTQYIDPSGTATNPYGEDGI